jgi:hypothetical protein
MLKPRGERSKPDQILVFMSSSAYCESAGARAELSVGAVSAQQLSSNAEALNDLAARFKVRG